MNPRSNGPEKNPLSRGPEEQEFPLSIEFRKYFGIGCNGIEVKELEPSKTQEIIKENYTLDKQTKATKNSFNIIAKEKQKPRNTQLSVKSKVRDNRQPCESLSPGAVCIFYLPHCTDCLFGLRY